MQNQCKKKRLVTKVVNMDYTTLDEALGDLYARQSVVLCPTQYGFHTRRPRRYSLLLRKDVLFGCEVGIINVTGTMDSQTFCAPLPNTHTHDPQILATLPSIVPISIFQILVGHLPILLATL